MCDTCDAKTPCLQFALSTNQDSGVWGGTSEEERRKLRRDFVEVKTPFGTVKVKLGHLNGRVVQAAPEFESCRSVAAMAGVPVKEVFDAARRAPIPGASPTP